MFEHARAGALSETLVTVAPNLSTQAVLERTPVAVWDADGLLLWASATGVGILGGRTRASLFDAVDEEDRPRVTQEFRRLAATPGATRRTEFGFTRADETHVYLEVDATCVTDEHGASALVCCLHDMSARHDLERELYHRALHDPLTALPNRALLEDRLEQAVARLRRATQNEALVILYVDVDRFKHVNDFYGHETGDRVVREIARRLAHAVRPGDTVARVGGDEFVIVCPDTSYTQLDQLAGRLSVVVAEPMTFPNVDVRVTASIGIAVAHHEGVSPAHLLREADAAMYRAKRAGRGRVMLGFATD